MTNYEKLVEALRLASDYGVDEEDAERLCADAAAAIEALQAEMPKQGEWVERYDEDDKPFFKRKYVCSACGDWNTYGKSKYCPNCGANMEVQDESVF